MSIEGCVRWRWPVALLLVLYSSSSARGERWSWPGTDPLQSAAHRIDNKVRFVEPDDNPAPTKRVNENSVLSDELPFKEPTDTEGFYNRPPGVGRYPVRVEQRDPTYPVDSAKVYPVNRADVLNRLGGHASDGTLDELRYCQCVSQPDCTPRNDVPGACGIGKFLCCYGPGEHPRQQSDFFNEVEERPLLVPGPGPAAFPAPSHASRPDTILKQPGLLIGPKGPTGKIGPPQGLSDSQEYIEPHNQDRQAAPADVNAAASAQRGVLVGPGGPTGIIGPGYQRPVLVGPGGPTGIIGPSRPRTGILVGPGGPTGIFGPFGYGNRRNPGVLVGPGGPTGIIGPRPYYGK